MSLIAKKGAGGFSPCPEGTHSAVCFAVIDLGTQYSDRWKKSQHRILLGWELDTEDRRDDGEPYVAWARFTASLHEKARLRQVLESWRGKKFTDEELTGFDLRKVLGKGCIVTITHTEKDGSTYSNVASVAGLPRGVPAFEAAADHILFDIDAPDMAVFAAFGDNLRKLIEGADEWRGRGGGVSPDEPPSAGDDDIPF